MDYYDVVLGSIPASLLGGTGVLNLAGFELFTAIPLAALVALTVIIHALFFRAPGSGTPEEPVQAEPRRSPPRASQPAD